MYVAKLYLNPLTLVKNTYIFFINMQELGRECVSLENAFVLLIASTMLRKRILINYTRIYRAHVSCEKNWFLLPHNARFNGVNEI